MKNLIKISLQALFLVIIIVAASEASVWLGCGSAAMLGCISVASIPEVCGPNPGGLAAEMYLIRKEDINASFVIEADGISITTNIAPKSGKGWAKWDLPLDKGQLMIKGEGEQGNQSITHEASGFLPRMSKTNAIIFSGMLNQKCFLLIKHDGVMRILGDWDRPLVFTYETKSGEKGKDVKGTTFKFMAEGMSHEPYFYTGTLTLAT